MSKIAIIVGSLREASFNRRVMEAVTRLPAAQGHGFEFLEIGDLPLYNQDQDKDQPAPVKRLKAALRAADGVILATPEYNRSFSGVLKNALDHASRPHGDSAWKGLPAAILGVSPGKAGTVAAQQHLRNVLVALGMPTLPHPEIFLQWQDAGGEAALVTEDGRIGTGSHDFLNGWLAAFIGWVDRHRRQAG